MVRRVKRTHQSGTGPFRRHGLAAVLSLTALLAVPALTQATLVRNIGQSLELGSYLTGASLDDHWSHAQQFTTGDNPDRYTLAWVLLHVTDYEDGQDEVRVSIYSDDGSGNPGTSLYVLTDPTSMINHALSMLTEIEDSQLMGLMRETKDFGPSAMPNLGLSPFIAPADSILMRETTYFVVVEAPNGNVSLGYTLSDAEDAGSASGWSIGKHLSRRSSTGVWQQPDTGSLSIAVRSSPINSNQLATGAPTIAGTAQVGETLTASTSGIADADGLTTVSYRYQWIRVDGDGTSNAVDIPGATANTYTLATADAGKKVQVKVSFQDDAGHAEARTSVAYPASGTIAAKFSTPTFSGICDATDPNQIWCATTTVGNFYSEYTYRWVNGQYFETIDETSERERGYRRHACFSLRDPADAVSLQDRSRGDMCYGSIDDDDFTVDGKSYRIEGIFLFPRDNVLRIEFTSEVDLTALDGLTFAIGNDDYTVSEGRDTSGGRGRQLNWNVSLDGDPAWDVDSAFTVALTRPSTEQLAARTVTVEPSPVVVSVADARVEEAEGATLDFVVSLSRTQNATTTVTYATSDGTAHAGEDYTAASGTLTFTANETEKTVSVAVLDDAHDEGEETLTLTLTTPSPSTVTLAGASATGTIKNHDPLQRAWLSRFGRTVGTHVVDAVGTRLRGSPGLGSHLTVGGYRLPLGWGAASEAAPATASAPDEESSATTVLTEVARVLGMGPGPAPPDAPWLEGPGPDPRLGQSRTLNVGRTFTLRRVLLGSSFRMALGVDSDDASHPRLTAWGRVAGTTFDGRDGNLTLDGDVLTGTVGVDGEWDDWLVGMAVAHSQAKGGYAMPGLAERGTGDLENTLTSVHPYLRLAVTDRLDVWGLLGYGWGEVDVDLATGSTLTTDTELVMGAFGGRGILLAAADSGGFQLATRTDAMLTRTRADAVPGLASAEADAHRLRVILEGSRVVTRADGRSFTPTVELGLRHDWGDAETGFGVELGGRVQYADPTLGLTIEGAVRGLLAHEDSDYQEWGASGTLRLAPGPAGRGLSLTLVPTWGAATSGVEGLWSRQTTAGLAPQGNTGASAGRLAADVGYGLLAPYGQGLLTPYAGTVLAGGETRTYRVGTQLQMSGRDPTGVRLSLEGQRQEPGGVQPATQGVQLQADWSF